MCIKHLHEIPTGSLPAGALNIGGVLKFYDFRQGNSLYLAIDTRLYHMDGE